MAITFTIQNTSAQNSSESECGTITSPEAQQYYDNIKPQLKKLENSFLKLSASQNRSSLVISSVPIKVHIIRTSAGTGGITEGDLNAAIANMNAYYANAFMEFFICDGINYIDSDVYYDFQKSEEDALTAANNVNGLINIYFTDHVENDSGSSLCGYAYYPGSKDVIVMKNSCATNGSTLPHEVGHFFSLRHTHGPSNSTLTTELVNGSNCDTDGDEICDTPADPQLSSSNVTAACIYTGTETDANGDTFAPDPSNIMSYSRKSCRTLFSTQQYARIYATYHTVRNYFACPSLNVDFTVDNNQDCGSSLTANFTDTSTGATSWQWDINSDNVIDYTTQNPTHVFGEGIFDVSLTISNGTNTISKTFSQLIKVGNPETIPIDEDFESFIISEINGWTANDVSGNGYNWFSNSGGTASSGTGPTVDNTTGTSSGTYIYAEASGASSNDIAEYISPCITINSNNAELKFAYHMYGGNVGELHVDVETDSGIDSDVTPALIGEKQANQTDAYITRVVDLSLYHGETIKIKFRAIRGSSWNSDIAIDDISIKENTLSAGTFILEDLRIYPNPINNDILHVQAKTLNTNLKYNIVNLIGQTIFSGTLSKPQINVTDLSSGTYFLILKDGDAKITKKFIKQ